MTTPTPPGHWKHEFSWENIRSLLIAFFVIVLFRTFLFQPFYIPSGSMIPSLLIGDNLFVSKWAYGYSRHSLPFGDYIPYFEGRIFAEQPQLGDIVVFRTPKRQGQDFIKRVVGLPGDAIQMIGGKLHINGIPCSLRQIADATYYDDSGQELHAPQFIETLPNGVEHLIIKKMPFGEGYLDNTKEFRVPSGHYFMVGDNRDGSNDSRAQQIIGFISEEDLIGRASFIFFSTGSHAQIWEIWNWLTRAQYSRVMTWVN